MMHSISLTAVVAVLITGCASIPAPTEQIAASKTALNYAADKGGREFAPLQLESAREAMNAAEQAMIDKDYRRAWQMAERARIDAHLAVTIARSAKTQKAARKLQEINLDLAREIDRKVQ